MGKVTTVEKNRDFKNSLIRGTIFSLIKVPTRSELNIMKKVQEYALAPN
jgi:hypothetical protein